MDSGIEYPPDYISEEMWNKCAPWIEAALAQDAGTHDLGDVLADIKANRATLWVWDQSCCVTQMVQYPRAKVLTFWLAGGRMANMLPHMRGIEEWAKLHGVTRFAVIGRKGWLRVLIKHGYTPMHYVTAKDA